jgi:transcriptional regulator with XRE-family HTH domain
MQIKDKAIHTPEELAGELGERLRALRLSQAWTQASVADKAGVSLRALRELEAGRGSTVLTLIRVLKALGAEHGLQAVAPQPTISPMAMLQQPKGRARGNR